MTLKSSAKTRLFFRIGLYAWGGLILGAIALVILQTLALYNVWQLPLISIAAWLGGTGLVAFLLAGLGHRGSRSTLLFCLATLLILVNGLAYFGAYTLTHFNDSVIPGLAFAPKPQNARTPAEFGLSYVTERITVAPNEWLETWRIPPSGEAKGTALLFPGNGGNKAHQLMLPAQIFHQLGYGALMVDFRGQGGSSGNSTTLGMREAEDVALALDYAKATDLPGPYVLYGVSLGSAAILRAIDAGLEADIAVLELPFAYLLDALKARMRAQGFPTTGIAELLLFWGSVQHGYNGFAHNPIRYAKSVTVPTLIFHGEKDRWTTTAVVEKIYQNLQGPKELVVFPEAGHNLLVTVDRPQWESRLRDFLQAQRPESPSP